ncbi:hypothetical protein ACFWFR_05165 [Oerskovia sp. NPDC060287]|uniref:hypothetical protein n=1 Tax=Oerskovia sp. NPDC060287 TaxID=3347095 RepID=UPI00364E86AA
MRRAGRRTGRWAAGPAASWYQTASGELGAVVGGGVERGAAHDLQGVRGSAALAPGREALAHGDEEPVARAQRAQGR